MDQADWAYKYSMVGHDSGFNGLFEPRLDYSGPRSEHDPLAQRRDALLGIAGGSQVNRASEAGTVVVGAEIDWRDTPMHPDEARELVDALYAKLESGRSLGAAATTGAEVAITPAMDAPGEVAAGYQSAA